MEVFLLLLSLVAVGSSLTIVTEDTFPHDGTRRFLWSASVYNLTVSVIPPDSSVTEHLPSLQGVVIYCDSRFLAVGGSTDDLLDTWKETSTDVLVHIDEGGVLRCAMGDFAAVGQVVSALTALEAGTDPLGGVQKSLPDLKIAEDEEGRVFLVMDRYPDLVGHTADKMKFYNFETASSPPLLIGSIASYKDFLRLTNYVPGVFDWNKVGARRRSNGREFMAGKYYNPIENVPEWFDNDTSRFEVIVTALYVKEDTALLDVVLERFRALTWENNQRIFLIFNRFPLRDAMIQPKFHDISRRNHYRHLHFYNSSAPEVSTNRAMHEETVRVCAEFHCNWVWFQDSSTINIQFYTLIQLAASNFSISSFLATAGDSDSPQTNFWGDTAENGFYARSHDYFDIATSKITGIFAVPFLSKSYLVRASILPELSFHHPSYSDGDSDIVFANSVRRSGHFIHLRTDREDLRLVTGLNNATDPYPFFEHVPANRAIFYLGFYMKWNHFQERNIRSLEAGPLHQPCEDVFTPEIFSPIFTRRFNDSLLHRAEGKWRQRSWAEGWEALETVLLAEVGMEEAWDWFSKDYLPTMVDRKFGGFYSAGTPIHSFAMRQVAGSEATESLMGKGVYTVIVPVQLGEEGGQVLINDQCTVPLKLGYFLIFPSRVTHRVRFIPPTKGEMVSIVGFYNDK